MGEMALWIHLDSPGAPMVKVIMNQVSLFITLIQQSNMRTKMLLEHQLQPSSQRSFSIHRQSKLTEKSGNSCSWIHSVKKNYCVWGRGNIDSFSLVKFL